MQYAKKLSLAVGLFIVLVFALLPTLVIAQSGSIGGKPANPRQDNPRTNSIFVHEIEPGKSVTDGVTIVNSTTETKSISIYATDAQISSGGAFACEQKAEKTDQEGSWIKLDKAEVTLGANKTETIGFTITVPKDATVGEHNACIAIQAIEPSTPSDVNGVQLNYRSAIRVAVTIPGEYNKKLTFESLNVKRKSSDLLLVNQSLRNSGNVSLDSLLDIRLNTLIGTKLESNGGEFPILANQRAEFNFEFKRPIWGGFYRVASSATYDNNTDTSLGEQSDSKETISKSKTIFVMPHPLVAIGYVLFFVAVIVPFIVKRRQKHHHATLAARAIKHTVKKGEDITSISVQYHANWKDTARLNNLKAPYTLTAGEELLVAPQGEPKKSNNDYNKSRSKMTPSPKKSTATAKTTGKKPTQRKQKQTVAPKKKAVSKKTATKRKS